MLLSCYNANRPELLAQSDSYQRVNLLLRFTSLAESNPITCQTCSRGFKSVPALRMHRLRAHGDVPPELVAGQVFGRLTFVEYHLGKKGKSVVDCECGIRCVVWTGDLRNGRQRSCGCLMVESSIARSTTHSMSGSPEHRAWTAMKDRVCGTGDPEKIENYYERGIRVCDEWIDDFQAFFRHVGLRPSPKHSIDRIDNDGNYEPGNVRWATSKQQANNRRRRRWRKRPQA